MSKHYGRTEPRLWTKPLRELTPDTSLGFEVIDYARQILHIELYPWQQWLLIHALELLEDGITYRYRRIIVLVGRQNGKTLVASVLASWWLHVDSQRHPDRVPPLRFKIVGTAQNLDIAREPWNSVKLWCDPEPETIEEQAAAIPTLQAATAKVSDTNGKEYIKSRALAVYEIRAARQAGSPSHHGRIARTEGLGRMERAEPDHEELLERPTLGHQQRRRQHQRGPHPTA